MPDLSGRTAVITGSSRGIGAAAAQHLARCGAHVIIACPSAEEGRSAADAVRRQVASARAESVVCDLGDLAQVHEAAERITALAGRRLHLLINNAGVAALPPTRSADGFEMHFAVNHIGHFALTGRLLPALLNTPRPRVVNVSSVLHWLGRNGARPHEPQRYHRWQAYFDSKLAALLFTHGLVTWARAHRLPLGAVTAHPGLVDTTLASHVLHTTGRKAEARLLRGLQTRWASPAAAAWTLVRAATDPHISAGEFLGPGGRWECSGPPVRVRAARRASDAQAVQRLWDLSQELADHPFRPPAPTAPSPTTRP
ncbi:putative oxidoreductase [Streptomyces ambofaciens ATCC 23877]|uniref:Putative oxidoreductase n=1 Tax=Streptomyces ambofaciens (strain ATCC 23877 / 3486 / DSM 40053 / JCM 4204 / NBRC 12836 / NRRL B-2516) TaxID=278992 RepID=A0A0K2B4Q2_STRA7|nr:SDR family NAD(P)-dependent oxidoreductase [Streptomyces ambofaciens]AKZ60259.1 putative oxidoreductase [Streptomyces ambofaciens ATCC 23877]